MLDTPEFERGRAGEQAVAKWLQERGWFVVPSYDYSGADGDKPPRLQGLESRYAIPDLDIARAGLRIWAEVKVKGTPSWHRVTQVWEHGISRRLHQNYCEVQRITGTPVWIFVLEERDDVLIAQSLDLLGAPRVYDGSKMGRDGMSFWPRQRFRPMATGIRTGRTTGPTLRRTTVTRDSE